MRQEGAAHPNAVLAVLLSAVFMNLLDVSIVNVAIPSVQEDLGASFAEVQLVLAGYQLAFACLLITGGRLGDIYGRKRVFVLGMGLFTLASLACGAAPSALLLILSRFVQGAGAGLMVPQVLSTIQVTIPPQDRGRAFGLFGATIGIAAILGPLVGGLLISLDLFGTDWRMIFLVNIPVGVLAVLAALRLLPESTSPDAPRLDPVGALLATAGLFLVVFPLIEGRERDWPLWLLAMLAASVPVLAVFARMQARRTRDGASPLLLTTLFSNRSFLVGLLVSLVFFSGIPAFFFTFGLYLQLGLGFSALHAGLTTFPFALASGFASSRSDGLTRRFGTRLLVAGALIAASSMVVNIAVLHLAGPHASAWQIGPPLLLSGLGLGCFLPPLMTVLMAGISGREAGSASGVLTTAQQVGSALGVALVGILFFGFLGGHATAAARDQAPDLRTALSSTLPEGQVDAAVRGFERCFAERVQSDDPSVTPAGCALPATAPAPVAQAFAHAAGEARRATFLHAIERSLVYEVAVFALAGLLIGLLPKVSPAALAHPGPPAAE